MYVSFFLLRTIIIIFCRYSPSNFGENVGQALMQKGLTANTDCLQTVGKDLEEHEPISCTSLSIIRYIIMDVRVTFSNDF